jgi:FkbM family methyltransferase
MNWLQRASLRVRFGFWGRLRSDHFPSHHLSHSQFGEDMALRAIFGDHRRNGTYVDIGAHHPVYYSNTYYFYRRGWRGLNVDAMPGSMDAFRALRPRDRNLECCLAGAPGRTVTLYMFPQAALNTIDADRAHRLQSEAGERLVGTRRLATVTLAGLLDEYWIGGEIDLLTIDVEGLDEEILRSNDWARHRPFVLVFERHGLSLDRLERDSLVSYLRDRGYRVEAKCGPSFILCHESFTSAADHTSAGAVT